MKQFLYGRLHRIDKGYDFYIPSGGTIGPLFGAISNDVIGDKKKFLFLQSCKGEIIFGLRERLNRLDESNRSRANFMGYKLEKNEGPDALPFFNALQEQFLAISEEAHRYHDLLDADSNCGKNLRDAAVHFGAGHFQEGNAWDRAVMTIRSKSNVALLMMFDEHGNALPLNNEGQAFESKPARTVKPISHGNPSRAAPGIHSSRATLAPGERAFIPPLDLGPPKKSSWSKIWNSIPFLKKDKQEATPPDADPPPPEPG